MLADATGRPPLVTALRNEALVDIFVVELASSD